MKQNIKSDSQLNEIKKGQTGTGLLIENDGHINNNCDIIKQIREDIANPSLKLFCPEKFIVSAVFQKYGVKNANGRIYPEDVLKREVEKYIQEKIATRSAIGALDHPQCMLEDTRVLTEEGWKYIKEVKEDENILTLTEKGDIEINPVKKKIEEDYKGHLICLKGRFIDIKVTPNHKFPIFNRKKQFIGFYTAQDILEHNIPDQNHCSFSKIGTWHNNSDENFVIPKIENIELDNFKQDSIKKRYSSDLVIPMETWMKFFGIYLSEGYTTFDETRRIYRVSIYQKKDEICDEIEDMLDEFPLVHSTYTSRNNCKTYTIYDMRLAKYLKQFGNCYEKQIPTEIKRQGKDMLQVFYDWFVMGDGRKRGTDSEHYYTDDVFSTSQKLILDLNEIQLKIGYNGSYHEEERQYARLIDDRFIEPQNCHNMYFSLRSHNKYISLADKSLAVTEEHYEGKVYCVEVKNHTFYVMCNNGKCLWSGNSSSLSGHDVAHLITELHWEGKTLVGEMEIHTSPGFRHYGVCSTSGDLLANMIISDILVGVSSRAVGSVKQMPGGVLMVDDDLELVSWDSVCEPSTPGAYIKTNSSDLQQFVESTPVETNPNRLMNEKLRKVNKLLFH